MKNSIYTLLLAAFVFTHVIVMADDSIIDAFPKDSEVTGWLPDGEAYIANDATSLMQYINGAAPFYLERGTIKAVFKDYARDDTFLSLEIYQQKDEKAAKKLYSDISLNGSKPLNHIGEKARFTDKLIGSTVLEMQKGHYFIRITIDGKTSELYDALMAFAKIVVGHLSTTNE